MSGEKNSSAPGAPTPQCQFFVQRKKRLCRMTVKPGRQYCGEHEPQPETEADQTDKRIPCPNDPKHTCYASKLLKHLAICNARRTEQPPYIVHNINAPEEVEPCPRRPLSSIPKEQIANVVDKVNHLYAKHVEGHIAEEPASPIHRAVLQEFSLGSRGESSRRHLRQVSALLHAAERAQLVQDRTCYVELGAGKGQLSYYACHAWCGGGGSRVLAVDRAPLRHKRDNKLRSAPPRPRAPSPASNHEGDPADVHDGNDRRLVCPPDDSSDRQNSTDPHHGPRDRRGIEPADDIIDTEVSSKYCGKVDATNDDPDEHRSTSANDADDEKMTPEVGDEGSAVAVRIRADLAHLALEAVPVVAECAAVVGLAKHLCGVATDYALRCVAARGAAGRARGVVLATCCHHRVQRAAYVAAPQLQELGIDAEDFNIMLGIVSWATCGDGRGRERRLREGPEAEGGRGLDRGRQEEAGRRAKALLDWGRVLWLRGRGFDARLARYVPREVSLENAVIIATKR